MIHYFFPPKQKLIEPLQAVHSGNKHKKELRKKHLLPRTCERPSEKVRLTVCWRSIGGYISASSIHLYYPPSSSWQVIERQIRKEAQNRPGPALFPSTPFVFYRESSIDPIDSARGEKREENKSTLSPLTRGRTIFREEKKREEGKKQNCKAKTSKKIMPRETLTAATSIESEQQGE